MIAEFGSHVRRRDRENPRARTAARATPPLIPHLPWPRPNLFHALGALKNVTASLFSLTLVVRAFAIDDHPLPRR